MLPVGATSYRAGFAPARNNTPFHGTLTAAGNLPYSPSADWPTVWPDSNAPHVAVAVRDSQRHAWNIVVKIAGIGRAGWT